MSNQIKLKYKIKRTQLIGVLLVAYEQKSKVSTKLAKYGFHAPTAIFFAHHWLDIWCMTNFHTRDGNFGANCGG